VKAIAARATSFSGVTGILTLRGNITVQSQSKTLTVLGVMANYGDVRKHAHPARPLHRRTTCSSGRGLRGPADLYEQLFANDESPEKSIRTSARSFRSSASSGAVDTLGRGDVVPETILIPATVAWYYTPTRQIKTLFAEVAGLTPCRPRSRPSRRSSASGTGRARSTRSRHDDRRAAGARAISVALIVVFILAAAVSVVVEAWAS
jgi:hypothetical protein